MREDFRHGGKFDFQDCGSGNPGVGNLSDIEAQRQGGAGVSHKSGWAGAGAVLDDTIYLPVV